MFYSTDHHLEFSRSQIRVLVDHGSPSQTPNQTVSPEGQGLQGTAVSECCKCQHEVGSQETFVEPTEGWVEVSITPTEAPALSSEGLQMRQQGESDPSDP